MKLKPLADRVVIKQAKAEGKGFCICGAAGFVKEVLEDAPPDVLASGVDFDSPPLEGLQAVIPKTAASERTTKKFFFIYFFPLCW